MTPTASSYKQYLAVGPFPSSSHSPEIGVKVVRTSHACIQIWSLGPSKQTAPGDNSETAGEMADKGAMRCEMVLCIESGPAYELKWCPLPAHDQVCTLLSSRS